MIDLDKLIKRKPGEKIIFFLRRHPLIFIGNILFVLLLAAIPAVGYFIIGSAAPQLLIGQFSRPLLTLLLSAYYLVVWLFFLGQFVDYYLDTWIVTSDKILNVEQKGLFARTVSELDLARVQDVTSEIKGVIPSIFGYGNVLVQTAGEKERFVFEQVPGAHEVRRHLLAIIEADRKRQGETAAV